MSALLRQVLLLVMSALISWWIFLGWEPQPESAIAPDAEGVQELALDLTPMLDAALERAAQEEPVSASAAVASDPSPDQDEEHAPPPELGTVDGEMDGAVSSETETASTPDSESLTQETLDEEELAEESASNVAQADDGGPVQDESSAGTRPEVEEFRANTELLAAAAAEFNGTERKGFRTVLLASPEDQLDISRAFAEEVVLVPKSALDPEAASPSYFRLGANGGVELVRERPRLEQYRQYRDLFDYEYARLPKPLRNLRRSVLSRSEIYLFAALVPLDEWAVVIGRRREALEESGRDLADVKSFTLRYLRQPDQSFDIVVEEIRFKEGGRFRPAELERKGG